MAFPGAAFRELAVFVWFVDGLLWTALLMSSMNVGMFLRGGPWLFDAPCRTHPAHTCFGSLESSEEAPIIRTS